MKKLFLLLAVAAFFSTSADPQQTADGGAAPSISKEQLLVSARTVVLIGALGHVAQTGIALNPSADKAQQLLEKEVHKWGRFTVIADPTKADLVLVLWEGNRPAGGGGVIRTARLAVMPGGQPPKRGDLPFWDDDASGSIFATSGAPKVVAKLRAYLENLDRTVAKIEIPSRAAIPGSAPNTTSVSTPITTSAPSVSASATASTATTPTENSSRSAGYVPPLEVIGRAKTFTMRGKGAAGQQGSFDKVFGIGEYSDVQSTMRQIHQQMMATGKLEFVEEVTEADLVVVVYQWDTRVYSKQFHGVRTAIQISEGREAFQREEPALWVSGTVKTSVEELMDSLRLDQYQFPRLQTLQATHAANKGYGRACDWMDSAEKKEGDARSDLLFEAVAELRKSLREDYGYAPTHERLGTALRELGFNSNAAYEYMIALQLQPGMQDAMRGLVPALAGAHDYEKAVRAARDIVRSTPDRADGYLLLGDLEYGRKNYAEAASQYQQGGARDPASALAREKLGRAFYRAGRMPEAEMALREALRIQPHRPDAMQWLGSTLNEQHRPQEAAEVLRALVAVNKADGSVHFELGRSLRAMKQYDQAISELNEAVKLQPTALTFHVELGHTLEDAGRNEEALSKYREIVLNQPKSATAHLDLANMLLKTGHPDQAIAESGEAVRLDGACARAYLQLGRARQAQGDATGAQAAYEKARSLDQTGTSDSCQ